MSHEPTTPGYDPHSTSLREAEPAVTWPVLAQLPWVDESTSSVAAGQAPAIVPVAEVYETNDALPPLRIVDPASNTGDFVERRVHAEAPHLAIRHFEWPASTETAAHAEPEAIVEPESLAPRWQRRIDPANHRQPLAFTVHAPSHETLGSQLFQWYAAIAPAAGVVVTVSLVIAAGWLYRMKFGAPQATTPPEQAVEAPMLPVAPHRQVNALPSDDSSAILLPPAPLLDWSLKPILDPPSATISPPVSGVLQQVATPKREVASPNPAEPVQTADVMPETRAVESTPPAQPVTPSGSPFPKTAYPDFDFSLLSLPMIPQPASVSELPTDAGTAGQAPH